MLAFPAKSKRCYSKVPLGRLRVLTNVPAPGREFPGPFAHGCKRPLGSAGTSSPPKGEWGG